MTKTLSLSLVLSFVFLGCDIGSGSDDAASVVLLPKPGLPRYQETAAIAVPGGVVSPAGGNLMLPRVDLSIDTRLGTREVGAVYNTADDAWLWTFDIHYDGGTFVDATGAAYEYFWDFTLANRLFPGGHWIRVDRTHIRSVGGLVHEFRMNGTLAAVYWQSAPYPRLEYRTTKLAGKQRVVEVRQCVAAGDCASVYSVERNAAGRVTALQDRAGRRAEFAYDAQGRLTTARDALDLERGWPGRRYTWWGTRLAAVTSSEGERVEYDTAWGTGQVLAVRQLGDPNRTHRFAYEATLGARPLGEPSRVMFHRDPLGRRTRVVVDGHRRAREVQRPSGATTRYAYTASSFEVSRIEHPDGTVTEWEYLAEDEIVRTDPSGNAVRMTFRIDGGENREDPLRRPLERVEDDLGLQEARGYANGRLAWIENGAGERTALAYGADGAIASVTFPDGIAVAYADYGEHGKPGTVVVAGETEARTYDAVGNLLTAHGLDVQDTRPGGDLARAYDGDRNAIRVTLVDAPVGAGTASSLLQIAYRSDGQVVSVMRPHGGDHEFVYDAAGSRIESRERVDGAWQVTQFEVDALGRTTAETLPNGMRREFEFDEDGALAALRGLRDGALESEASMTYVNGRLATRADAAHAAAETLHYDAAGRVSSIDFPDGESLEFAYDVRGRRTAETYRLPGGSVLRELGFAHDLADRETALLDGGAPLLQRSYGAGRIVQVAYANGVSQQLDYDPVTGLLAASFLWHPSQGVVGYSSVEREVVPSVSAVEVAVDTTTALATTREEHRLGPDAGAGLEGKRLLWSGDGQAAEALGFDALSNLTQLGSLALLYNAEHNRLEQVAPVGGGGGAPVVYTSDAAGYVSQRGGDALAWTAFGQIAAVGADAFEYDGFGRPLRRVVAGVERRFRFGGRVETDAGGVPVRMDLREVVLELDQGEARYRHFDYRGNVAVVSDATGAIVAHYEYDGYGVLAVHGSDDGAATFAGGRSVGELVVLGPRVHDPLAARFLAPDPIFQLASQFAYTPGNPVVWRDASGFDASAASRQRAAEVRIATGIVVVGVGVAVMATVPGGIGAAVGGALITAGVNMVIGGITERAAATAGSVSITDLPGGSGGGQMPALRDVAPRGAQPDPGGRGCSACQTPNAGAGELSGSLGTGLGSFGGFGGGF